MTQESFDRRPEVEQILAADETRLGDVWRWQQEGLTIPEMAERAGNAGQGGIFAYVFLIGAMRDAAISQYPTVARGHAARIRKWLKEKPLSPALRADLTAQEARLMAVVNNVDAQELEDAEAAEETAKAESSGVPGIYVYTLPHYLRHPVDPESGRTYLKVGHSSTDAHYRANSQARLTALPEDPRLLRIYPVDASAAAEREFHQWLLDASHARSRTNRGGQEWFLTSVRFLDRIAVSMGLEVRVIGSAEVGDE